MAQRAIPTLGTLEAENLEFKSAEITRTVKGRRKLMEEVVGMLNAKGGRVFVGIQEKEGAAAALDPIAPEQREDLDRSIRDMLVDAIEPPVTERNCELNWHTLPNGFLLELRVSPTGGDRAFPYCLRHGNDRRYLMRVRDRLRVMNLAELMERFGSSDVDASREKWFSEVCEEVDAWWERSDSHFLLIVGLQPLDGGVELSLPENAEQLLNHPPEDLFRRNGWTFETAFPGTAKWRKNRRELRSGYQEEDYRQLRVDQHGRLAFRNRIDHLQWSVPEGWSRQRPDAEGMIFPCALVETTVSLMRLAAALWEEHLHEANIHVQLRLSGVGEWLLPPYSPNTFGGYHRIDAWHFPDAGEILSGPHRWSAESFEENPDGAAWNLLVDIYAEYDYEEKVIPCFSSAPRRFVPPG